MRVLLIDDDQTFCETLARALARRKLQVRSEHETAAALATTRHWQPTHVVLDLKLGGEASGLDLIEPLLRIDPALQIIVLTGYASIATTVTAIKRGAAGYLAKPVDAQAVLTALGCTPEKTATDTGDENLKLAERMSLKRLEWEHINRVLAEHDGNVSAAARTLGLYRRTLQRKLDKRPVQD